MAILVLSLDFELFWGITDSRTLAGYRENLEGVWQAIPRMLALFRQYEVRVTWATVGMLMCRDYAEWRDHRPAILPGYQRARCSTYALDALPKENPRLFFARPLVEQILDTPGQELASHTYSHFFCDEVGATPEQFAADLACAREIASRVGVTFQSMVFPRNQVRPEYVAELAAAGVRTYRGNPEHWLYRNGHFTPFGKLGRAWRYADGWLPLTGSHVTRPTVDDGLVNVPASLFVRPWSPRLAPLMSLRLARLQQAMTDAAKTGGVCHLWWHPHNFGVNLEANLIMLETLLRHFRTLQDRYGMQSQSMAELAETYRADQEATL